MEGWREQWLMSEAAIDIRGRKKGAKKRGRVQTKWQRTDSFPVPVASEQLGLLNI